MIQKTLITDNEQELTAYIQKMSGEDYYRKSGDQLLLFTDQNNQADHLKNRFDTIRGLLPKIKIVGISMPVYPIYREQDPSFLGAGYSFLLMERAKIDVFYYDFHKLTAQEAGKQFRREIRYKEHVAGIMLLSAGVNRDIDRFLATVAKGDRFDIPIIGVQSGADHTPYICGNFSNGLPCDYGIAVLVFSGRGLNVYYNYDMGWKAIGKEMRVTKTTGNYCVSSIDNMPAVSIYQDYLGVEPDEFFIENVREFPFVTMRGDRQVVRTPSGFDENGNIQFIARVYEGDTLKLSYGNPKRLLDETKLYVDSMRSFGPQALFLVICENRALFLGDQASTDITGYQSFMPQLAWVRGFSAIMVDKLGGGIVNSAVLSLGMREGAPSQHDLSGSKVITPVQIKKGATPRDQRLAMFLEKTTKELEDMAIAADSANAAKSEFLSQMSHEIRTPINAILGMNEMILRESHNESILRYARNVQTAGLSLLGIISDILDFSKIEACKMEIFPYEYELASMINDLVNLIKHRAEGKGLELYVEVNPSTPHLMFGDELRIKQIITNLLTNAVKYTEKGSVTFIVDYHQENDKEVTLVISVKDTGVGIKKENISKLFDAFDRIDLNRARKIEGTGLGINITQQLLTLMDSDLKVESTYGEGSVFSFSLRQTVLDWEPIGDYSKALDKVKTRHTENTSAHFTAPEAHILVVDDAPMNLDVIRGLLKRTKIRLDTADSGAMCIEKFGQNSYDLVFLDHRMPNMDGVETLLKMKEIYGADLNGVPVISLTANAVAGAREEYLEAGFIDYLTKPVMSDELEAMLLKYLPPEKITSASYTDNQEEIPIPEWLEKVNILDIKHGVEFCGGNQEYLDALKIFRVSISSRADEIEALYQAKDIRNYTIKVHALKSMTRTIGAMELSELAASLEEAGNNGDIASIEAGTGVLLTLYRELDDVLKPFNVVSSERNTASAASAPHVRHILLVDDDTDFLSLLERWLKKDYRITTASSGSEALTFLEGEQPDLVLLDFAMPGMSGADVLKEIRENPATKNLPVVFLTGTEDRETAKSVENLYPEGFLLKSTGKSGLLTGISSFFD